MKRSEKIISHVISYGSAIAMIAFNIHVVRFVNEVWVSDARRVMMCLILIIVDIVYVTATIIEIKK